MLCTYTKARLLQFICCVRILKPVCYSCPIYRVVAKKFILCL